MTKSTTKTWFAIAAIWAAISALPACGNLQNNTVPIEFVSYTPDEHLVLLTAAGLYVYDGQLANQTRYISLSALAIPSQNGGLRASLSADGTTAAVSYTPIREGDSRIAIYRIADGDLLNVIELPGSSSPGSVTYVGALALSPDGTLLFARGGVDGAHTLMLDTATGTPLWTEEPSQADLPVWSPDGATLFFQSYVEASTDGPHAALQALDARTGALKWTTALNDYTYFYGLAVVGGGALLAGVADRPVTTTCTGFDGCEPVFPFWSATDGTPAMVLPPVPGTAIYGSGVNGHIAFTCNATDTCAMGFQRFAVDSKFVRIYKTDGTKLLDVLTKQSIDTLAVSPSGAFVAVGHPIYDGSGLSVYRVEDGKLLGSRTFIADTF